MFIVFTVLLNWWKKKNWMIFFVRMLRKKSSPLCKNHSSHGVPDASFLRGSARRFSRVIPTFLQPGIPVQNWAVTLRRTGLSARPDWTIYWRTATRCKEWDERSWDGHWNLPDQIKMVDFTWKCKVCCEDYGHCGRFTD